eukprot:TRINITY_DN536_c1_g1_i3.p2 TRINITY_DN536_c1_g1~~TRINITY_DN536_c1_g1_i3.p2  ORF type:complete len:262 (-),score=84.90 TRINITY_DN536_c1_g1_i3:30-815(-)
MILGQKVNGDVVGEVEGGMSTTMTTTTTTTRKMKNDGGNGEGKPRRIKQDMFKIRYGASLFNADPKRGVQYLIDNQQIENSEEGIALFLLGGGADKEKVGEYLGEHDEKNIAVLQAYTDQLELRNMGLVEAMRKLLVTFRLPGEAQKIDRIMEAFASSYLKQNKNCGFENEDAIYVLAFSIIMLNTDLHNAQVANKMTKEAFIKNNRGMNNGKDYDKDLLEEIYDELKENEMVMDVVGREEKPVEEKPKKKGWRRRKSNKN